MSSYFDDASLVVIPSGYKTSKVYSVKPLDGTGDLTFTRSNDTATRVAPNGLIEKVRTNVATYSQDFSNVSWLIGTGQTKTQGQTDPNGGTTAVLVSNVSEANGYMSKALTLTANVPNTFSIYIKGSTSGSVSLRLDDSTAGPQFDINYTTSWQRFSVTRTVDQSSCFLTIGGYSTWAVGENIQFAFAQVETGDIATQYIATTSAAVSVGPVANVPRLDYLGSSCPRLLLEGQRSNLNTNSENVSAWGQNNSPVVTVNNGVSPDGYQNADKVVVNSLSEGFFNFSTGTVTSGTAYTLSVFVKYISGASNLFFGPAGAGFGGDNTNNFNIQNGTVFTSVAGNTASVQSYGNGWYRLIVTKTASATDTGGFILYGTGSDEVQYLVWGAQVEAGAYATSYIPTLGASVTRGADAASKTSISSLIGQTEGTLFMDLDFTNRNEVQVFIEVGNGSTQRVLIYCSGNSIIGYANASVFSYTQSTNERIKIAFAYKSGDSALYVNGVQKQVSSSALTFSSLSNLYVGMEPSGIQTNTNPISQALLFKTRLSNADLAALTA